MAWITDPGVWAAFLMLTALEIVLGIDNIIFISILASTLPRHQRARARTLGLAFAMITRIALLLSLAWMMRVTTPLFTVLSQAISGRDLILIVGGLFLIAKATLEIHAKLEGAEQPPSVRGANAVVGVLTQIALLDIVFSLDSVITAIGMVDQVGVMVAAIVIATLFMMVFSGPVSTFIDRHPTVKMLALSFLVLVGVVLVADGFDMHVPKGYIYFAMSFSVLVEMLNLRLRRLRTNRPARASAGAGARKKRSLQGKRRGGGR